MESRASSVTSMRRSARSVQWRAASVISSRVRSMPELLVPVAQGVPTRMLAQHELGRRRAHGLRGHDLVGEAVAEHAVLVDAGGVGERVVAHDGLVGLGRDADGLGKQRLVG